MITGGGVNVETVGTVVDGSGVRKVGGADGVGTGVFFFLALNRRCLAASCCILSAAMLRAATLPSKTMLERVSTL